MGGEVVVRGEAFAQGGTVCSDLGLKFTQSQVLPAHLFCWERLNAVKERILGDLGRVHVVGDRVRCFQPTLVSRIQSSGFRVQGSGFRV